MPASLAAPPDPILAAGATAAIDWQLRGGIRGPQGNRAQPPARAVDSQGPDSGARAKTEGHGGGKELAEAIWPSWGSRRPRDPIANANLLQKAGWLV